MQCHLAYAQNLVAATSHIQASYLQHLVAIGIGRLVAVGDRSHWTFEGALYVAPFLACFLDRNGLLFPPGVDLGERSPTW